MKKLKNIFRNIFSAFETNAVYNLFSDEDS